MSYPVALYEVTTELSWGDFQRVALLTGPPGLDLKALLLEYKASSSGWTPQGYVDSLVRLRCCTRITLSGGIVLDPDTLETDPYGYDK